MADRRKKTTVYGFTDVNGNTAYDLNRNAVRELEQEERQEKERISDTQLERAKTKRVKVILREQQKISLVAVGGFVIAGLLAVAVLASYIQLNSIYASSVTAQNTLTELQSTYAKLAAEDEETFDSATLQKTAEEYQLQKPTISQQVYLELSEPDNTVVYRQETKTTGIQSVFAEVKTFFGGVGAYFR